jgi:flagellar protein FliO/FliZ
MEIEYLKYVFALLAVVGLIIAMPALARRFVNLQNFSRSAGSPRRLALVETISLDARRKLMLVRRDGVEHLLLLGANSETVLETGINLPTGSLQAANFRTTNSGGPPAGSNVSTLSAPGRNREDRP